MKARFLIAIVISLITAVANAATWQLPSGYFVPAKMPMTLVNPRPDSETASWARNRLAYPDGTMQYRVPVAVQGGAYPFHYDLVNGPTGMNIGQDLGDKDYGIVTWTPTAAGGPYTVTVKVTDQELNTVTATWTVKATTSGFVFIDPNAPAGGDGSKAHPFNNTDAVFGPTDTDATYAGYQVIFRGTATGSSTVTVHGADSNGNITFKDNLKPVVWLGYTGEKVNLDFSHCKVNVGSNQDDIWIQDLNIKNARTDVSNYHFFYFSTNSTNNRTGFFENNFSNISNNPNGTDNINQACILMFNPHVLRNYFTFMGNTLNNFESAFVDLFAIKYGVIENNQILTGTGVMPHAGFYLKADLENFSVRKNTSLSRTFYMGAIFIEGEAQAFPMDNIEVLYNNIRTGDQSRPSLTYFWRGVNGQGVNVNPHVYIYRNTLDGWIGGLDNMPYTIVEDHNILIDDTGNSAKYNVSTANRKITSTLNLIGTNADGYIDSDGILTGSTGSQYRGTRGHEISVGVNPLSAPAWQ